MIKTCAEPKIMRVKMKDGKIFQTIPDEFKMKINSGSLTWVEVSVWKFEWRQVEIFDFVDFSFNCS
jgi:hypothetical protein